MGENMKSKIVGILVCIMLMTTFLTMATNVENVGLKEISHTQLITSSFDDDVPTWNVGDWWTYTADDINIDIEEENQSIHFHLQIDEFNLTVVADTGDFYKLDFTAEIIGDYAIDIDLGEGPINVTGEIQGKLLSKKATIDGYMLFNKTDLGIKKVNGTISWRVIINVNEHPYDLPFSIPPIPIPTEINLDLDWNVPYTILDFPLNTSKAWGLPATNISIAGTIKSPWLNLVHLLNTILRIPGIMEIVAAFTGTDPLEIQYISDILFDILPIIDIEYVLNEYLPIGNVFEIPEIPPMLYCNSTENITVKAGNFSAYKINLMGADDLGYIYYAPSAKNIIKITGKLGDFLPFVTDINMELKDFRLA